jgi:hypothetical protein
LRKLALTLTGAVVAAVALAPAAQAGPTQFEMKVSHKSSQTGTKAKPRANTIKVELPAGPAGKYAAKKATISLDKNWVFNTAKLPSCTQSKVQNDPDGCNPGSKIGKGTARGIVSHDQTGGEEIVQDLRVDAFNGGKNNKIYFLVRGDKPVEINAVLVGTLKNASGKYGKKLDVVIPASLQNIAGFVPTLVNFITTIDKTVKGVPAVASKGCTGGKWNWGAKIFYTDGSTVQDTATTKCRK